MMLSISMKFHENILNGFKFQSNHDWMTDGQTDGQKTEAKTICLHPCQGESYGPCVLYVV